MTAKTGSVIQTSTGREVLVRTGYVVTALLSANEKSVVKLANKDYSSQASTRALRVDVKPKRGYVYTEDHGWFEILAEPRIAEYSLKDGLIINSPPPTSKQRIFELYLNKILVKDVPSDIVEAAQKIDVDNSQK